MYSVVITVTHTDVAHTNVRRYVVRVTSATSYNLAQCPYLFFIVTIVPVNIPVATILSGSYDADPVLEEHAIKKPRVLIDILLRMFTPSSAHPNNDIILISARKPKRKIVVRARSKNSVMPLFQVIPIVTSM